MTYVFGPVPSRRLGLSLGVDLLTPKTCSYDCLYCQVGKTARLEVEPHTPVPLEEVLRELTERLERVTPDFITFSGSGEPTLHSGIGEAIARVKDFSAVKVAVITNGSLLWREDVRERLLRADVIMPTLCTVKEETHRIIHRPHGDLVLPRIIRGLKTLRNAYRGELNVEVMLLAGLNESDEDLAGLREVLMDINPDRIHLNTVVRPPADAAALSLDRDRMEEVKGVFGERAEIIASAPPREREGTMEALGASVMDMAKRRPVSVLDICHALGVSAGEAESVIKGLVLKGHLRSQAHLGETYYVSGE